MGKKVKTADPLAPVRTNPTKVTVLELNPAGSRNAGQGWFDPLPVFPPEILGCKNLVELEIYRGIVDGTIPDGIGALTKLTSLGLGGLPTTRLPESLGKLTKLETLSLAYMQSLSELPVSIGKLTKLRELDMPYAGITALPPLGTLRALRTANFSNTPLAFVHPTLWQCTALETLYFPDTLERLPPGIAKLTKLRTLSVSPSALASIAVELPKLKLTALHVHGAGELPAEVGLIKTLGELRANFLGLTSLPDTLPKLVNLESLEVSGNKLATLIDLVAQFPKLVNCDYSGNPVAVSERRELDKLMKLSPSKRAATVTKRVSAPVKAEPKPKAAKAKLSRVGQVASVNASLSLIIADAKVAEGWSGIGDGDGDNLDGTDWDRARVALAKKDYAMLDVGRESAVALSLGVGQGVADVFRVGDRIVVVESIADDTEDELFLEFVASAPQKPKSVANLAVPSKRLVMVPSTDAGDSEESLALDVPAKISITLEAETKSSWGQARRMFITPA
jgi:hypothetical protein